MAIIVNFYGVPGAGKSTGAAYIFSKLKDLGYNAELVPEFAKGKVWEGNTKVFQNQAYIFGKQFYSISRVIDEVEVIVTDSPLMLSAFYNDDPRFGEDFNKVVHNIASSYPTINFFVKRVKKYNPKGRLQTEEQSDKLQKPMLEMMNKYSIDYEAINGDFSSYDDVVKKIAKRLDAVRTNKS